MGSKPSNSFEINPPDSGGTARERRTDNSGVLEQEKEKFAAAESEKARERPEEEEENDDEPRP